MVYTSTRIKRAAAEAFDAETVETDDLIIEKPDGFLNVIGGDPKYLFEAYSKDFGGHAKNLRMIRANVTVRPGTAKQAAADVNGDVVSDISEVIAERRYRVIETKRTENDIDYVTFHKIAEKEGRVFRFEIDVLAESDTELLRKADAMLASFELK
jgi:hypothetical protein